MKDKDIPVTLETKALDVGYYKDLNILQNLNIKARKNKITAILGANGVGKSTALKAIFGFLAPNAGEVLLEGENIINIPTYKKILKGLAYIPQQPGVFKDMTVEANLELGGWTFKRDKKQVREKIELNYERFPVLKEKRKQITGELSGGQQRMVEIGRTLMADPKMMLIDEPTAGLDPVSIIKLKELLSEKKSQGKIILITSHIMSLVEEVADEVIFLLEGKIYFQGTLAALRKETGSKDLEHSIAAILES